MGNELWSYLLGTVTVLGSWFVLYVAVTRR